MPIAVVPPAPPPPPPPPPSAPPSASPPATDSTIIFRTPSSISPYSRMVSISARMESAMGPRMSLATSIAWAAVALLILIPSMLSASSASEAALQWVSDQTIHSSARA